MTDRLRTNKERLDALCMYLGLTIEECEECDGSGQLRPGMIADFPCGRCHGVGLHVVRDSLASRHVVRTEEQ